MRWFVASLRENPELAIFLTLALGFVIGRFKIGSFRPGQRRQRCSRASSWDNSTFTSRRS